MAGFHFKIIRKDFNIPEFALNAWAAPGHQECRSDDGLVDQWIVLRPKHQDLTPLSRTIRKTGCYQIGICKLIRKSRTLALPKKRMLEQIVAIPATLYLPTGIVAELNEFCETL
jgi:hypothetical protein